MLLHDWARVKGIAALIWESSASELFCSYWYLYSISKRAEKVTGLIFHMNSIITPMYTYCSINIWFKRWANSSTFTYMACVHYFWQIIKLTKSYVRSKIKVATGCKTSLRAWVSHVERSTKWLGARNWLEVFAGTNCSSTCHSPVTFK